MTQEPVSPLRRRMIEDMSMRQFGAKTRSDYVRVVREFAAFIGRSPDLTGPEDLRRYQLHLAAESASPSKMNAAVAALRFFFKVTLGRPSSTNGWRGCGHPIVCRWCSVPRRWCCCCTARPA